MSSRRLAAILCADVVGSSRLMEIDEPGTISAIDGIVYEVVAPAAARHNGRLIKTTGDGAMLEFSSPLQAVTCAIEVQREATERCAGQAEHERLMLRIGINLGDVLVADDGDVYGDCVNVAVRLESLADPGGICVSAKVRDELQGKMTLAFEDRGDQQLKNIARPVRVFALGGERTTRAVATPLPVPDKPSIAVLPFTNLSGDPEQDYFADGIVDDILTALGRQRSLFVSARSSTFTYKGRNVDPKRVGSELGVRYLLLGSIRRAGNRVRITGRLIEAESGTQIWADRYDGALDDVFELQDEITASVAGAIEPRLRGAEIARARLKPPGNLTSYDRVLQALSHHYEATKEGVEKAIGITDKIIEDDPGYAQPYALGAWCRVYYLAQAWSADPASDGARAVALARRALDLEHEDPSILWMAGVAIGYIGRDLDTALALLDRSLSLNPSSAQAHMNAGWVRCWLGRPDEGIRDLERAIRLSPLDRTIFAMTSGLAVALCMAGRDEESIRAARQAVAGQASWAASYRPLAASLAQLGRIDEARRAIEQLLVREPDSTIGKIVALFRPSEGLNRYLEGLRLAGLPE
jgi:adenylate cyclase